MVGPQQPGALKVRLLHFCCPGHFSMRDAACQSAGRWAFSSGARRPGRGLCVVPPGAAALYAQARERRLRGVPWSTAWMRCWTKTKPSRPAWVLGQVDGMIEESDPPPEWLLRQIEEQAARLAVVTQQATGWSPCLPFSAHSAFCVFAVQVSAFSRKTYPSRAWWAQRTVTSPRTSRSQSFGQQFAHTSATHSVCSSSRTCFSTKSKVRLISWQADAVGRSSSAVGPRVFLLEPLPFARSKPN